MQIHELIVKHINGEHLTDAEAGQLLYWRQVSPENELLFLQFSDPAIVENEVRLMHQFDGRDAWARLQQQRASQRRRRLMVHWRWPVAATLILLITAGTYLWNARQRKPAVQLPAVAAIIGPGRSGALLTLANGSQVSLDTMKNGVVALQGGVMAKLSNGTLTYEGAGDAVVYNTVSTPKGRQMRIGLPDGTKVWLNAASSIHFPTVFNGTKRRVEVTGEAYFEVVANHDQPFTIATDNVAEIEVLGTQFNINAYSNEPLTGVTLIEGKVKVRSPGNDGGVLRPGQQAQINTKDNGIINFVTLSANEIEKSVAWKNGFFNFENTSLEELMRQLERWYDVEVMYENGIPNVELTGSMKRDVPLNGLIIGLEKLGVHTTLKGRILIVKK